MWIIFSKYRYFILPGDDLLLREPQTLGRKSSFRTQFYAAETFARFSIVLSRASQSAELLKTSLFSIRYSFLEGYELS